MIEPITAVKAVAAVAGGLVLLGMLTIYFGNLLVPIVLMLLTAGAWALWRRRSSTQTE